MLVALNEAFFCHKSRFVNLWSLLSFYPYTHTLGETISIHKMSRQNTFARNFACSHRKNEDGIVPVQVADVPQM